jgi:DNA-binding transcriptional ArsR family regulator
VVSVWKALADDSRRKMLLLLREKDMFPSQLAGQFNMTLAAVSTHLRILKDANLVTEKREGQRVRYSLSKEKSIEIKNFFERMWGSNLNSLKEYIENKKRKEKEKKEKRKKV